MILGFDRNPNLTPEQQVQSLMENVQLAFNEATSTRQRLYTTLSKALGVDTGDLYQKISNLEDLTEEQMQRIGDAITGMVTRIETLEGSYETLSTQYVELESRVRALEEAINGEGTP